MNLLDHLRAELAPLMKRRETVALRAVRDAIAAVENAETSYLTAPAMVGAASEFVAGALEFGHAERIVRDLSDDEMLEIANQQVSRRLDGAARFRALGDVDAALTLKAEALALTDRLEAYARLRRP